MMIKRKGKVKIEVEHSWESCALPLQVAGWGFEKQSLFWEISLSLLFWDLVFWGDRKEEV